MLTIGGNQTVTTVTGGRTTGVLGCGGALNYATIAGGADNCGVAFVGGTNCNVTMGASRSGLLIVGGGGNNYIMSALYDSMIVCGPDNGVKLKWTHSTSTASLMMNGKTVNVQYSQTVTHEAPFTGDIKEYTVGDPVFCTGRVCKYVPIKDSEDNIIGGEWSYSTSAMDCICELKPEGTIGEFVGIVTAFVDSNNNYTTTADGDTKSILFASHGDFYFNVQDSSKYKTGDVVLIDGTILSDDQPITGKITKMIVGRCTGKINKTTIAVLKD